MSRFDDELIKQADNAYQMHGLSGDTTTPRQQPYDQTSNLNLDGAFSLSSQAPTPANETADWVAEMPMARQLEVRDLDAADPGTPGQMGEIVGGPGSSAVYSEGQPMYASRNPIEESLFAVYKASREVRDAISQEIDFDFGNLLTASNDAATVLRFASADENVNQVVGTIASIVLDIETALEATSDFRQASADLQQLESLVSEINKRASSSDSDSDSESDDDSDDTKTSSKSCGHCKGKGCDKCKKSSKDEDDDDEDGKKKKASNGNQESLQVIDVRDLDDQAGVFDRDRVMAPDHTTDVLVPEEVNGEDAGYVPFYNDGSETGIVPQDGPHHQEVWPLDGTNPAFVPYAGQGTVAAVQASREKIFESLQIVERLEKLGMVDHEDRAKHIAKFEQMSDASLEGFKIALDGFEKSGARQPRSQKVASGNSRMPEMGRLTTASTVKRQDLQSDDWLMTL